MEPPGVYAFTLLYLSNSVEASSRTDVKEEVAAYLTRYVPLIQQLAASGCVFRSC
jgi:hypothetical protein